MSRFSPARFLVVAVLLGTAAPMLSALPATAAAKKGQLCAKADEGKADSGLTCTKDSAGTLRWTATPPTTKAVMTTQGTTKSTTKSTTKATTKSTTKITTQATTKTGTDAGTAAKKGQFCKKADIGKKATDAAGVKLTCTADPKGGTPHWTAS